MTKTICPHPSWIEIDLKQFRSNLAAIRKKIGERLFCLPVKANAYGHGLCEMGVAAAAAGVDYLGVSCLSEGAALRAAGISLPILVFGAIHEDQINDLIERDLEFSVSSRYKAELVLKECTRLNKQCRIHLEVDTGMHRTGVRPDTAVDLLFWLLKAEAFEVVGIYSHLATGDVPAHPFALKQIAEMKGLADRVGRGKMIWHLANSGGVTFYPESYFDMVRPGLVCYGYLPDGKLDPSGEIAPCFSLKAKVSYFKVVAAGEGVSYGHLYRTAAQTRIVTVPVGYGDGYRRALSNQGTVLIRGKRYQIAGAICMDQFMVDIGMSEVFVGDEVTLIGGEVRLEELSHMARTIPYELLCALNDRLPRVYFH
jgi:alanine racemase